jgi:signal peptidase II
MIHAFFLLLGIDQLSKFLVLRYSSLFNITIVFNKGIAFGALGKYSSLVIITTFFLLVLMLLLRKKLFFNTSFHNYSMIFILSGGFGNLIDRLLYGHVIDFLKIPFIPYFNFADLFINIGMILYFVGVLKSNGNKI